MLKEILLVTFAGLVIAAGPADGGVYSDGSYFIDSFSRDAGDSLGSADTGQTWSFDGPVFTITDENVLRAGGAGYDSLVRQRPDPQDNGNIGHSDSSYNGTITHKVIQFDFRVVQLERDAKSGAIDGFRTQPYALKPEYNQMPFVVFVEPDTVADSNCELRICLNDDPANIVISVPGIAKGHWYRLVSDYGLTNVDYYLEDLTLGTQQRHIGTVPKNSPRNQWPNSLELFASAASNGIVEWDNILAGKVVSEPIAIISLSLSGDTTGVTVFQGRDGLVYAAGSRLKGVCYIHQPLRGIEATVHFQLYRNGKEVFAEQRSLPMKAGTSTVAFDWSQLRLASGENRLSVSLRSPDGKVIACTEQDFYVMEVEGIPHRLDLLQSRYEQLLSITEAIEKKKLDSTYQRLVLSIGRRFLGWMRQEDLPQKRYLSIGKTLDFLETSVERSIRSSRGLLADPSLNRPVPRYDMSKLTTRDGGFFVGENPVFLFGPVAWFSAREFEDAKLGELGFNAYEGFMMQPDSASLGPWWMPPDGNSLDSSKLKEMKAQMDVAVRQNIAYGVLLSLHYIPEWFKATEAYKPGSHNECFPFLVDHPATKQMVKNYLDLLIPQIKDYPVLAWYSFLNEMVHWDFVDYSEYSLNNFRKWLQRRYGKIEVLNRLWGANYNYDSFSQVQPPPRPEGVPLKKLRSLLPSVDEVSDAAWYDWQCFNEYRVNEFVRWGKSVIRSMDPVTPFMVEAYPNFRGGGSGEALSLIGEISGTDRNDRYDFFRSVCPEKPVLDTEFHYSFKPWLPQQYFEYETWRIFMQGCDGMLFWVWNRNLEQYRPPTREPQKMEGFGKAALDVQRLGKLVHAFQRNRAQVAVFFSDPSWNARMKFWDVFADGKTAINWLDAPYDIITDRLIDEGKLADYKLLVAPQTDYVSNVNFQRIVDFVQKGGYVVLIGKDCMSRDAYGRQRDIAEFINSPRVLQLPAVSTSRMSGELDGVYEQCGITRSIRCRGIDGSLLSEVEMRVVTLNSRRYAYIINHSRTDSKIVTLMAGKVPVTPSAELINNKPITGSKITLKPMEVVIYEL